MKKLLLILTSALLTLSAFTTHNESDINTVYTSIPVKLIIEKDSTFNINSTCKEVTYSIKNDTILKIGYKTYWEDLEIMPTVKIKTPNELNIKHSRYLKIQK